MAMSATSQGHADQLRRGVWQAGKAVDSRVSGV